MMSEARSPVTGEKIEAKLRDADLRRQDVSIIRKVPDHQKAVADPARDESLIFELLDMKYDVADEGSAVWFLQFILMGGGIDDEDTTEENAGMNLSVQHIDAYWFQRRISHSYDQQIDPQQGQKREVLRIWLKEMKGKSRLS
ncbi:hypothetical protein Drorol1_Dr00005934 [Drosera rotundifolia]